MSSLRKKDKTGDFEDKTRGIRLRLHKSTGLKRANFASKKLYNLTKTINPRKSEKTEIYRKFT